MPIGEGGYGHGNPPIRVGILPYQAPDNRIDGNG